MRSTGSVAGWQAERSIARSFRLSGKKHLLITGGRGSGKTTLLGQLVPLLSEGPAPGITTWAQKSEGVWLWENNGQEWSVIDEIDCPDCGCEDYCKGILALMEQKRLLAVVRKERQPFLEELQKRQDVYVYDLDAPAGDLGCVIMASGLGRRFGGNKLMADFGKRPMLAWALDATEGIFARRIVVTRHEEVEVFCRERGIAVLRHELPYRSDTVRLGLESIGEEISGCMFCPGDQPLLGRESVQTMALTAVRMPEYIWQLAHEGRTGAPVVFPKWAFEELRCLPEGNGGRIVLKNHPDRVRFVPAQNEYELRDVDRPDDLNDLIQYIAH